MFTNTVNDSVHENILWPDLPYVKDEHGNVYFQVKNEEDILQALTSEENIVQVIVGLDTTEMIRELEALGHSGIDFGIDELDGEDSDYDDEDKEEEDNENNEDDEDSEDWVAILHGEEDEESDGSLGDWAKLETMRSYHPMYFAKKLTDVASDVPLDFMEQPCSGLVMQGLLRPAFVEEHSVIQKNVVDSESGDYKNNTVNELMGDGVVKINGHLHENEQSKQDSTWAEELEKEENLESGFSFYKLEMIKVQLISAHGQDKSVARSKRQWDTINL